MNARFAVFAAAVALGAPAAADPPKSPPQHETVQPHGQARAVVLAAADAVPASAPAPDQQNAAAPKRPRFTRVTTCRCGDADADAQAQPEE